MVLGRTLTTDLCGLATPVGLEGASLRPLLLEPATAWDRPAYTFARDYTRATRPDQVTACAIRTERWRYAEWDEGKQGAFLYDHTNDPHELKNLVSDPAYVAIVKELKTKLARFPKGVVSPRVDCKRPAEDHLTRRDLFV